MKIKSLLLTLVLSALSNTNPVRINSKTIPKSVAQTISAGTLDGSFGGGVNGPSAGLVRTDFGNGADIINAMQIQADGKIVVAGESYNGTNNDFALARYNADGTPDNTFGDNSSSTNWTRTDFGNDYDYIYAMQIQADGKIVVAGKSSDPNYDFALARYNADGIPDNTFGDNSTSTHWTRTDFGNGADVIFAMQIQSDGKIVVAGVSYNSTDDDFALARYNADGIPDNTFGDNSLSTNWTRTDFGDGIDIIYAMQIQADGKIVVAGVSYNSTDDDFALARYNADGIPDNTFGDNSLSTNWTRTDFGDGADKIYAIQIQSDGKIVVAGYNYSGTSYDFALARYLNDINSLTQLKSAYGN
ncbi:MAG: putative delta-60 repeat protein, partial [Alteromonas naphthalenivorans]